MEISSLLEKEAIEEADPSSPGFYGRLFIVPKSQGGFRPVLDLSALNRFLRQVPFRMETPLSIREAIRPGDWATSLDLKDAYFHVLIHHTDRKWLRFAWGNKVFQFRALPFGLSLAPWVFTRVVRAFCSKARLEGLRVRDYLDDWLLLAPSKEVSLTQSERLVSLAMEFGFVPNWEKFSLLPSQAFTFLGMAFDTTSMTVSPAPARLTSFASLLLSLTKAEQAPAGSSRPLWVAWNPSLP